jgi:hypothetical protein
MKASTFIHRILCPTLLFLSVLSMLWLYAGFVAMWQETSPLWKKFVNHGICGPYLCTLFSFAVIILGKWYLRIVASMLFLERLCFVCMLFWLLSN